MNRFSTAQLKGLTTGFLVIALMLMMCGPWVLRSGRRLKPRDFLGRVAGYGAILGFSAVGAGACAFLILRRERDAYREQARENLQALIEATREDHLKKGTTASEDQDGLEGSA